MSKINIGLLTVAAMLAFAANSILCRWALRGAHIDAASFTLIRLAAGAVTLALLVWVRGGAIGRYGSWWSACALLGYAAGFSFAYLSIPAAVGALLLFGSVQSTMIGYGLWRGERLDLVQSLGLALACLGLVGLMLPGLSSPPLAGAVLMIAAGVAWGIYSLRGRAGGNPIASTAGNFIRAVPLSVALSFVFSPRFALDFSGIGFAAASGAITSGLGYAAWYSVLPSLRSTSAATLQLSVPVLAALGGAAFLDEPLTLRLVLTSAAVLVGVALVIRDRRGGQSVRQPKSAA